MRNKRFQLSKRLLTFAMALLWFGTTKWVSVFLFGEYPYPEEK